MRTAQSGAAVSPGGWFWLLGAPVTVVGSLLLAKSVFVVFALYHLGFCVLLPALYNLGLRGFSLKEHLEILGLVGAAAGRGIRLGLALGVLVSMTTFGAFHFFGGHFLATQDVPGTLTAWGVNSANFPLLLWFMILANGPAEEMYWRGFVHTELVSRRPGRRTVLLIAGCYASYHGLTVYLLVANFPVALLFMAAIVAVGYIWGWLREKTGSVWPALISHSAAAASYMIVARPLLDI